jgi:hypothetical protein
MYYGTMIGYPMPESSSIHFCWHRVSASPAGEIRRLLGFGKSLIRTRRSLTLEILKCCTAHFYLSLLVKIIRIVFSNARLNSSVRSSIKK